MSGMKRSVMSERAIVQPTGNVRRKSYARLTVTDRNGRTIRVERLEHEYEDELHRLGEARREQLHEEFSKSDYYIFVNKT